MLKTAKFVVGNFGTNCYFLYDPDNMRSFVVDPGYDFELLEKTINERGFKVEAILLTHAHFDHIMALKALKEYTSAPVYLHEDEAEMLSDPQMNMTDRYGDPQNCITPDRLLKDGDILKLADDEIKVMHTPGHTPGSCCYITGGVMISGDTLFLENIGRYDFPGGNYKILRNSLSKISALDRDYRILPGHGPSTTLSHEKQFNIYLQ
ncbi:MAG: MBL fold metallo-hydrolase [Clostridia bacterium]|nr:MBL fold metallo-hydrolase [Clostridia bacterium]